MQDKALFKVIKLYDVNSKAANILKQTLQNNIVIEYIYHVYCIRIYIRRN